MNPFAPRSTSFDLCGEDAYFWENTLHTKVLIIDDDVPMTDLMRMMLNRESFDVITANTGEDGIEAVKRYRPDVIVLDLLMPGEDGWHICNRIRKSSQVPILVLSALNMPGLAARVFEAGADEFLIKPVSTGVLVAYLRKLTRRARAELDALAANKASTGTLA
jgi:DNA-binding response OmpR family regulator